MSDYNAKNYTAQGGSVTVIGGELQIHGKLTIEPGAEVEGLFGTATMEVAEVIGVGPAAVQLDSTATSVAILRADFNLLLANLRAAGVLATDDRTADSP